MRYSSIERSAEGIPDLSYKSWRKRNISSRLLSFLAGVFACLAVLPLIAVLIYILIKGVASLNIDLFTQLPPPPGGSGGGVGNAILGSIVVTAIATMLAIPIGVGGGIYLAEYSTGKGFSQFIRFGTNVLAGVPSIIAGVFIYGVIVSTRILFGHTFSAIAGGAALSVLMLPTVVKTTDEGLKLVSNDLRRAAFGVGASHFVTVSQITLPKAFTPIATGVVLSIARAAGETAPLIFTALFSPFWPNGIFEPIATLSVLIYNFSAQPYDVQNQLAWAASFILVVFILALNLLARWLGRIANQ
ncbi:phosphate ABC transporter permease PstA [Synechococcus sp. ROS8604]|jgi:phosphate transport system permease protein|uniref:phosphate ABC transporter permease PstA n=1 Tax=Synechococcus sp. ROS8604 TaxID=1442557 RepID=UPI001646EB7B|nr:phosphate ABC transporter permease PstA [Synechococcus sp. ROS8604]NKB73280.1 phosphate ABC transporter permease PstA [Synechococcus sp. s2_metabat2_7]QNI88385.1 ABC-type phosphate transport system permease component [Synechococcus sp. ROS8604]